MDTREVAPYRFRPLSTGKLSKTYTSRNFLFALNRVMPTVYAGTVPRHVIVRRRMRNKMARLSRRINRAKHNHS